MHNTHQAYSNHCNHSRLYEQGYREARNALLEWIKRKIPDYNITGFSGKQWNDGKALNALIDALSPCTGVFVRTRVCACLRCACASAQPRALAGLY